MARVKISEFGAIQKALAYATVAVYVSDDSGEKTSVLATIYQAATGSDVRENPQTLDENGQLQYDCYVDDTVIAEISGITNATERLLTKIKANPLQYPLSLTSAKYLAQSLTAADVIAELPLDWMGPWVSATDYVTDNLVSNNGSAYICIADNTSSASSEPGTGASWTTYWELFAQKGNAGAGTGDLLAANNLSDLASAATALANLSLRPGIDIQAYDPTLAALAGWANGTNKIPYTTNTDIVGSLTFRDQDDMASDDATGVPSQQSVKKFVSDSITAALSSFISSKIVQIKHAVKTDVQTIASTSFADISGLSISLTPSDVSNKVLLFAFVQGGAVSSGTNTLFLRFINGSTPVSVGDAAGSRVQAGASLPFSNTSIASAAMFGVDTPGVLTPVTYKVQAKNNGFINRSETDANSSDYGRAVSGFVAIEIEG